METKKIIKSIKESLKKKYGDIPAEWEMQLDQLATHMTIYSQAKKDIDKNGILSRNRFDDVIASPAVKVLNDASIQMTKLAQKFGLSAYDMKKLAVEADENDDFVQGLLND